MKIFKPSELEAEILFEALGNRKDLEDFTESGYKNVEDLETFYQDENGDIFTFTYFKVTTNNFDEGEEEKIISEDYRLLMTAKELEQEKLSDINLANEQHND